MLRPHRRLYAQVALVAAFGLANLAQAQQIPAPKSAADVPGNAPSSGFEGHRSQRY
jgi:hypothetical protein